MVEDRPVEISMEMQEGYRFLVDFHQEGVPPLLMDEPPPLGEGAGPGASRVLAAAIANCLSASALFCLRKARIDVKGMRTTARASIVRNEKGRLRVGHVDVTIEPRVADDDRPRMQRCLELFEDFCVVTQSVRSGVEVRVEVAPSTA